MAQLATCSLPQRYTMPFRTPLLLGLLRLYMVFLLFLNCKVFLNLRSISWTPSDGAGAVPTI